LTPQAFDAAAMALPGVTKVVQWGGSDVYKVGGRIFAIAGDGVVSFKATDLAFEVLVEAGWARPAPYLARAKWLAFDDLAELDETEVADWLATAHQLVAAKLARKVRAELGL
jgi:predicted DNA-binding protein (MmcQ/YjbR family)